MLTTAWFENIPIETVSETADWQNEAPAMAGSVEENRFIWSGFRGFRRKAWR